MHSLKNSRASRMKVQSALLIVLLVTTIFTAVILLMNEPETVYANPDYEDFLADYVEVDEGADILVTQYRAEIVAQMRQDAESWVVCDKGVDYFDGNFSHALQINLTGIDRTASNTRHSFWALGNINGTSVTNVNNRMVLACRYAGEGVGNYTLFINSRSGGVLDGNDISVVLDEDVEYYPWVKREGYNFSCSIYSDENRTALVDMLNITLGSIVAYRYIFAIQSYGGANDDWSMGYTEYLDLNYGFEEDETAPSYAKGEPSEGEIRFAILNDVHLGMSGENYTSVAMTIDNLYTKYGQLDFIIIGQDVIHQVSDANYQNFIDAILRKMRGGTFPIFWRGNHESDSNNNYGRWWNETSQFPDRWAFKYKGILFIGIPTGGWGGDSVEWDANYQFMRYECEQNPSITTIVFTPEALWNTTDAPTGQNSTGETGYVISSRFDTHERLVFKNFLSMYPQIKLFVHAQNHVNDAQNNGTYEGVWVFGLSGKDFGGSTIPGTEIVKVNATSISIQICNGLTGEDIGWGRNFFLSTVTSFNPTATNYFSQGAMVHDNDKRQIWSQFITSSGNVTLEIIGLYSNSTENILPDPDIQWCHWTAEDDIFLPYVGIEGAARWENWTGSVLIFRRTAETGTIDLVCPIRRVSDGYNYLTEWLPFTNGSTYELEIECKANQTTTNCLGFEVKWHGVPGTWGTVTNNTANTVTTSYQNFTGRITAPANALTGQFKFTFDNCSEDTTFYVDRMTVKIVGQTHTVTEGANVTINGVTYGASGNLTGLQSNSYQVPLDFGATWMRCHCTGSKMFMYRILAEDPQFFVMNKPVYQSGDDWNLTNNPHSTIYNFSYIIGINLTLPQFKLMNGTEISQFTNPTWSNNVLECNVTGSGDSNYVVYCYLYGNATHVSVDGHEISWTYNSTWESLNFSTTLSGTHTITITWNTTKLYAGWNEFSVWTVDVTKSLGQVNSSVYTAGVTLVAVAVVYTNGTRWAMFWNLQANQDKTVATVSDRLFIYCNTTGYWSHTY